MAKIITKFKGDNKDFKGRKKEIGFLKTDEIKQISQFSQTEILEHFDLKNFGLDYDEAKEMGKNMVIILNKKQSFIGLNIF